jgi:hypothetical protein
VVREKQPAKTESALLENKHSHRPARVVQIPSWLRETLITSQKWLAAKKLNQPALTFTIVHVPGLLLENRPHSLIPMRK